MKRFTIDPANFTDGEWAEMYNASTLMPRAYETRDKAQPFNRDRKYIQLAIECLNNKAQRVLDGGLGPEGEAGEDEHWANELENAAATLTELIGAPRVSRKEARALLYDLLTQDIYTDAPEYAERVAEIHRLIDIALK